jgi:hypothetical protein
MRWGQGDGEGEGQTRRSEKRVGGNVLGRVKEVRLEREETM